MFAESLLPLGVAPGVTATTNNPDDPGAILAQFLLPNPFRFFNGRAVAFDGTNLWTNFAPSWNPETHIYKVSTSGSLIKTMDIGVGVGALAWDSKRNLLWGSNYEFGKEGRIYTVDPNTGVAILQFTFNIPFGDNCFGQTPGFIDGLDYDATTDILYLSDDGGHTIYNVTTAGIVLSSFAMSKTGFDCNSGIAFDGQNLWLVAVLSQQFVHADKKGNLLPDSFGTPAFFAEDIAYDSVSFAPKCALWANEATFGTPKITAFEVPCSLPKTLQEKAVDLAKTVVGAPYLGNGETWGGKGWEWIEKVFVTSEQIRQGYNFWNNKLKTADFGAGLDCSGLVFWTYNKASGATVYAKGQVPVYYDGADGQFRNNTEDVGETELKPSDLLFFDRDRNGNMDHVAMYVGGNDVIEAANQRDGIKLSKLSERKADKSFVKFRRVTPARVGFEARAHSPVDLVVTDPEGFTIDADTAIQTDLELLREIPGVLYYSERDVDGDGTIDAVVTAPTLKTGDYVIRVVAKPEALPTNTYSLDVEAAGTVINMAQNILINDIPKLGYGIRSTVEGITQFVLVAVDIKPGSFPNSINPGSEGTVPVVTLSSSTFNATTVDPLTVTLAGAPVALKKNGKPMASFEDANSDGLLDLVVHVNTKDLNLTSTDTQAILEGKTLDSVPIKGSDSVRIVPPS